MIATVDACSADDAGGHGTATPDARSGDGVGCGGVPQAPDPAQPPLVQLAHTLATVATATEATVAVVALDPAVQQSGGARADSLETAVVLASELGHNAPGEQDLFAELLADLQGGAKLAFAELRNTLPNSARAERKARRSQ